jgi:hypothetical protein
VNKVKRELVISVLLLIAAVVVCRGPLAEAQTKPNILVIMGDDIGY